MCALEKLPSGIGHADAIAEVRLAPETAVTFSTTDSDIAGLNSESVLDADVPHPGDGDSSSCHSDQTVVLRSSVIDPEQERNVKAGIFGQILVFLRTNAKKILREREIPDLAASIGQSYCALHPEVLQSCQINIADLCSFVMKRVQEITGKSNGVSSSVSGRGSGAGVQPQRLNGITQVPRKHP